MPCRVFIPTPLGRALVLGYDDMGLAMSKPDLRAHMESQMQRVAEGSLSKADCLGNIITIMRDVYRKVVAEVRVSGLCY